MATKKKGLQKNVSAIFSDASLPRDFIDSRPEVREPTQETGAKAAPKRRGRKTADSKASATTGVARPPEGKEPSSLQATTKKKLLEEHDAAADGRETISNDSAETGLLDPPLRIADESPEKKPTSVESRVEDAPIDKVDTSRGVDESSIDVELPSDTPVETADKSPAPTKGAEAEETATGDQAENSAQVITKAPRSKLKESPPLGSVAFLEHLKKTMDCLKNFESCQDHFIDICKAKVSGNGKKVICLEGKHCGCRFQTKSFFKRICTCDIRQLIAREHGY